MMSGNLQGQRLRFCPDIHLRTYLRLPCLNRWQGKVSLEPFTTGSASYGLSVAPKGSWPDFNNNLTYKTQIINQYFYTMYKLDGVGPVDNRPSTD